MAISDRKKAGYRFVASESPSQTTWAIAAEPVQPGITGDRYFYVDESGVIRFREDGPATTVDRPVD